MEKCKIVHWARSLIYVNRKMNGTHYHHTMLVLISSTSYLSEIQDPLGCFLRGKIESAASQMSSCLFPKEPSPISLRTARIKHQKTVSIFAVVGYFQAST